MGTGEMSQQGKVLLLSMVSQPRFSEATENRYLEVVLLFLCVMCIHPHNRINSANENK